MTCERALALIPGLLDGELDAFTSRELEEHLSNCGACQAVHANLEAVSRAVRTHYEFVRVPDRLVAQVRSATIAKGRLRPLPWPATLAIGALLGALLVLVALRPRGRSDDLARDLFAAHVRSLMASSPVDVLSSDRHTVKPWFQGKLDFSPEVYDLANNGYPLVGGRVEFIKGRPAAALVFHSRLHVINVFVTSGTDLGRESADDHGFHLRHFSLKDLDYWAVSDVNPNQIEDFVRRYVAASAAASAK